MNTKRICACMAAIVCCSVLWANGTKIKGIYYVLNHQNMTASVTYTGSDPYAKNSYSGVIEIPSSVTSSGKTYRVTHVGEDAFKWAKGVTGIVLPNSVKTIGKSSFSFCQGMTSITLSDSITEIPFGAFFGCKSLNKIVIPEGVTAIGFTAFHGCTQLESVTLPKSIRTIEPNAFDNCPALKEVGYQEGFNLALLPAGISPSICHVAEYQAAEPLLAVGTTPPNLTIVAGSVSFSDRTGNSQIDASEQCFIRFQVRNIGKGNAVGCVAEVRMEGTTAGVSVNARQAVKPIAAGATEEVEIPISTSMQTQNGQLTFTVEVTEPRGFGAEPFELSVNTRAFEPPYLQIVDYAVTGSHGGRLTKKQPFNLQLMLQNTKYGKAENVEVELVLPANVFLMEGKEKTALAALDGGKAKSLDYQIVVTNNYNGNSIPVQIRLKEKHGKYAEDKSFTLELNQSLASSRLTVNAVEEDLARHEIQLASIGSDVDKNIPVSKQQNKNTFAVIIANENYQQVAKVPFALNDGNIFKIYCEKTLGIPATNIHFVADATINNIRQQVNWLSQVMRAYDGKARVLFYYAGHGVPDEQNKTAFLLPVDGNGSDIMTGYKLDDLYAALGELPSQSVTVFLDACFSGSKREGGMLASARGVAIKTKTSQPVGKTVVFSAATGDETAYPNKAEGHGMFTYYLLKKLQETSGDVTYEELGKYIRQNVSQQSIVVNGKSQTPTVIPSADATDWQNWKMK